MMPVSNLFYNLLKPNRYIIVYRFTHSYKEIIHESRITDDLRLVLISQMIVAS